MYRPFLTAVHRYPVKFHFSLTVAPVNPFFRDLILSDNESIYVFRFVAGGSGDFGVKEPERNIHALNRIHPVLADEIGRQE